MDKNTNEYPEQNMDEEVSYKVYYYSDSMFKPSWVGTQTFDDLDDAKEYAEYRMRTESRIKKTVVMKLIQTTQSVCIKDTLKTKDVENHE